MNQVAGQVGVMRPAWNPRRRRVEGHYSLIHALFTQRQARAPAGCTQAKPPLLALMRTRCCEPRTRPGAFLLRAMVMSCTS